jgi:L-ribulose-5-phosphate 3-epimerase
MNKPELSVALDDLKIEAKAAMERASALGFRAIDVGAIKGPISPDELSSTGRRHLLKHLGDLGLRLGSLRGPVGGPGYADAVAGERRIETMRRVIELASSLHVPVASTSLGLVGGKEPERDAARLREALTVLADHADRAGVIVAVETSGIDAASLQKLLAEINCPLLASCCDSGAMLMEGQDPHRIAETLPGRIKLVRARDAITGTSSGGGREVAQGQGNLEVERFLAALNEAAFQGDIILTRTTSANPAADLRAAQAVFAKLLA